MVAGDQQRQPQQPESVAKRDPNHAGIAAASVLRISCCTNLPSAQNETSNMPVSCFIALRNGLLDYPSWELRGNIGRDRNEWYVFLAAPTCHHHQTKPRIYRKQMSTALRDYLRGYPSWELRGKIGRDEPNRGGFDLAKKPLAWSTTRFAGSMAILVRNTTAGRSSYY